MRDKSGLKVLLFAAGVMFLISGCASFQELETPEKTDKHNETQQAIKEKDEQISRLEELINDQQQQLRQLNDSLNDCQEKLGQFSKNQPNLK